MTKKAQKIMEVLEQMFPDAKAELNHKNPFELLIAVVLSAQATDISVNRITPALFSKYPTPELLANANLLDLEESLKSIGLYRNKAKHIKHLSYDLVNKYGGNIPSKREDLESLAGVGRKTANVVLSNAFSIPAFAVDTHVSRVSKRLMIAKNTDSVFEIEKKLMKTFPKEKWLKLHHQLIFFGRYHCLARNPKCYECPLYDVCGYGDKMIILNKKR